MILRRAATTLLMVVAAGFTLLAPTAGAGVATAGAPATAGLSTATGLTAATIPGPVGPAEPTVEITINAVEPSIPQPGDVLVIEGSVTNISDVTMRDVQALFRHNLNPLDDRAEIRDVDTDPRRFWGSRPGHVFHEVVDVLPPGASADFLLELRVETACPAQEPGAIPCVQIQHPGVYVIGVDIREGDPNVPRARVDAGTVLTFLPWLAGQEAEPDAVSVAMLWPLVADPATLAGTGSGIRTGSPLRAMLDAAGEAPVTWLVDASLLDDSAAGDTPVERLRSLEDAEGWLLPYARPDLGAFDPATAERLAGDSVRLAAASAVTTPGIRAGIAWPTGGTASPETLSALDAAGAHTAILSAGAFDPAANGPWVDIAGYDLAAVVTDAGLDAAVRTNDESGARLRQRWLAETHLAALTGESALVTGPPPGWDATMDQASALIDVWTATPWVQPVPLTATDVEPRPEATPATSTDQVVLPADNAAAVVDLLTSTEQYRTLLADGSSVAASDDLDAAALTTAPVRAAAAAWQSDPAAGITYTESVLTQVTDSLTRVSVQVAPVVTLSSNTGAFPVNVVNGLDAPVTVRLDLHSANPDRMSVEPITEQRIEAGETEILRVTAEAVANGRVRVDIQLATVDGTPLGEARHTVVNATEYGLIGWFLIAGATVLFVAGLALRTVRGRRRNGLVPADEPAPIESTPLDEVTR